MDLSEDEEREIDDIISLTDDKYSPQSLEKMIALIALLVEKSRVEAKFLRLSDKDSHALIGGKVVALSELVRLNLNFSHDISTASLTDYDSRL